MTQLSIWIVYQNYNGKPVNEMAFGTREKADRWCESNGRHLWFKRAIPICESGSLRSLLAAATDFAREQQPSR